MSFQQQIAAAISAARTYAQIDALNREIAAAWGAKVIGDDAAQCALEALQARKRSLRDAPSQQVRKAFGAPPKRRPAPRSPDRAKSIARRRACATSGAVPSAIASGYTLGEIAVLSIVAAEVKRSGRCDWPVDRVAAQAGVCRRLAQLALRHAAEEGLITIEERPRLGRKSLTNVVTITSKEWRAWLRLRDRMQKAAPHGNHLSNNTAPLRGPTGKRLGDELGRRGDASTTGTAGAGRAARPACGRAGEGRGAVGGESLSNHSAFPVISSDNHSAIDSRSK